MPFVKQIVFTKLDETERGQRIILLVTSQIFDEATNSSHSLTEQLPAVEDVCVLVEQKISRHFVDKEIKSLSLNREFDLYYQVNLEPGYSFTTCLFCIAGKGVDVDNISNLFESIKNTYVEVEYIRDAILSSTLDRLPHFKSFMDREVDKLNQTMNDQKNERVNKLQQQVQEVKTVMSDNVIRVMERGERLDSLDQRAETLQQSSAAFKTSARRVQRSMCFKNLKWTIILGIVISLIVVLVIVLLLKTAGVL